MNTRQQMLTVTDHNRSYIDMTYVYPVVSRRAKGVSVGINLNPNNACNWHCAYCQVPGLVRGAAPAIDEALLVRELQGFLHELIHGRFMAEHVPEEAQVIRDIAFSGNGEPTSCATFSSVVRQVVRIRDEAGLACVPIRLITNGSQVDKPDVQAGLSLLAEAGGEVWFKLDAGTQADIARINGVSIRPASHARRLALCASLCPTWVQTCMFRWDDKAPTTEFVDDYLALLEQAGLTPLKGVLLYGLARQSFQPEAVHLKQLSAVELESIAGRLRQKGLAVTVSP
ncbi:radical SAM protein [Zoogloea sp. LCSB751]|uniref:radical SAM protein n=1 Tax=Zoogloea sp. LCSB751 TaxID=1965277 RepID=UPI0009A4B2DB|nr:radical SAM protein [Zoogloea sp. LCSB751]